MSFIVSGVSRTPVLVTFVSYSLFGVLDVASVTYFASTEYSTLFQHIGLVTELITRKTARRISQLRQQ